ncbi:NAD-dependent epimerase [Bacillaceae bacterium CLA-AA-H227]|uniref:NAD-dependent epimerase n=1 Tax=Robertmurraya yapensis (ex Hitch et al 2024) TaxID=3133160 RepID=A0ACC6SEX3_9BACI
MVERNVPKLVLVTGCAGFIGFHLSKRLLEEGSLVVGIDQMNDYYEPQLKWDRLNLLKQDTNFSFMKGSIENMELLEHLFQQYPFEVVVHLAAQAGVRYSLTNPDKYIQSNMVGFANILECCRNHRIPHLLYASSSSVYGNHAEIPFSESARVDEPISLYAATKRANELMAYTYSHLYQLPATGMRFFTVYGPWGRPDMAVFSFTQAILNSEPIKIYNYGKMKRDFTYIDDCIESIVRLIMNRPNRDGLIPYKIYNIGNQHPVSLSDFIEVLEKSIGKKAQKEYVPLQQGDVLETFADLQELIKDTGYKPLVKIDEGMKKFIDWYRDYYK